MDEISELYLAEARIKWGRFAKISIQIKNYKNYILANITKVCSNCI